MQQPQPHNPDLPAPKFTTLLALPDFRRIWLIGICSGVVRWLEMLAFGIYVFDLTGSAFLVATFTLLRFIPFALFGAVTGALVDKLGHRKVLRYSLMAMFASSGALVWLTQTGQLELWHLAVASALAGIYWTTDFPARRNLIGLLAGPSLLARALSFDAASNTLTRAIGPLIGGALMASLGITGILMLTLGLYFIALLFVLRLSKPALTGTAESAGLFREIWNGFKFALTDRNLLAAYAITVIFNLFGFPFTALIPVIGKQTLGLAPDAVGMIAALEGLGAVFGALAVGRVHLIRQIWTTYIGGVATCLIGIAVMGYGEHILVVGTGIALAGFGAGLFAASQVTLIYRLSPAEQRSRMLGVLTICIGTAPFGFALLGYMADWLGSGHALLVMSVEGAISLLLFWLIFRRDVQSSID